MKIKIVSHNHSGYVSDHDPNWVMRDCTGWDEVTEDEYKLLVKWAAKHNREVYDPQYIIYRQEEVNAKERIQDYLDMIAEEELLAETRRKKREANAKAKAAAKKALKESQELAQLKQLADQYGVEIKLAEPSIKVRKQSR